MSRLLHKLMTEKLPEPEQEAKAVTKIRGKNRDLNALPCRATNSSSRSTNHLTENLDPENGESEPLLGAWRKTLLVISHTLVAINDEKEAGPSILLPWQNK
ncbi:unnamed protein product [Cuscuta epithymum]|uniref:Uncharacterized protein n=1 Tax=Cuscuta epithymum TaxID=186058 RepID=A0AAV0DJV5_9ASTE|nr:unnamed protein product [Cuscuta epithymum]